MAGLGRREFSAILAGFAAAPLAGCSLRDAASDYSVAVLGDLHYDSGDMERFHAAAIAQWTGNPKRASRFAEFRRNAAMWGEGGMSRRVLAASGEVSSGSAFVLQVGDLVQGDCLADALHQQMLSEATELLVKTYPGKSVFSLCGNHDIRQGNTGRGAAQAYSSYMLPWESKAFARFAPEGVASTTFGWRCGPDLWIALDFNYGRRDIGIVKKLLADNPDVRYTFLAAHGSVLPMDLWRCRWFYLGAPAEDDLRREMRALFARRKVITLSGHSHAIELRDWQGDGGRITEFVFNSVASGKKGAFPAEPRIVREGVEGWGGWVKQGKKPAFASKNPASCLSTDGIGALYDEYRPGMKRYMAARGNGHYQLRVSDSGVSVDYYGHGATKPTRTYVLREA